MKTRLIFNSKKVDKTVNLDDEIAALQKKREYLHGLKINDILDYFQKLTEYWEAEGFTKKYRYLKNIHDFLQKQNLKTRLNIALHNNLNALDEFVDLGDPQFMVHAQPRGLTVHWLAGNVSILGLFSIFSSLITKNVALVKASSKGYEELVNFLDTLSSVSTKKIKGKEISSAIRVVLIDRKETELHEKLSLAADVRIAWGGHDAIETITNLKKSIYSEDIIFGPKYSYAAIDAASLKKDMKRIAQRLAIDVSVFDQYACSSPHTVFIEKNTRITVEQFAEELAKQLDIVQRMVLPKQKIDEGKTMEIVNIRTRYMFTSRVFKSKGTEWTVVCAEKESGLADACFSRVIYVKEINKLSDLKSFNTRQRQTLGIAFSEKNKKKLLDEITLYGIDRCPDLGYMTFFESPWDGMFVFDRLVRWVSTYK